MTTLEKNYLSHYFFLFTDIRVPLMFRGSGIEPKTDQKSTAVITLDIAPTLLGDFGCGTLSRIKL